jgi:ATP-dependent DNA ligase
MLAKISETLPPAGGFLFEPKWDGFRAIVFRGSEDLFIQSRDSRPLDRYFPDLHDALMERLPEGCVIDGEIVIATAHGLDFDALQMRLHPAASRVAMWRCWRSRRPPLSWRSTRWRSTGAMS